LMKTKNQVGVVRTARWALGAAVLCCAFGVQAAGKLEIKNAVFQEVEVQTDDGRTEIRQVPAARVIPGTEVIYVIDYSNVGDGPVDDVAITNPVPKQLVFVSGDGPLDVSEVSIDNGEAFAELADLTVTEADGATRPAETRDVTHLRWNLPELPPGGAGAVSF